MLCLILTKHTMDKSFLVISITDVIISVIPVFIVVGIFIKWSLDYKNTLYGISRMLLQLVLVGYMLTFIFESNNMWIVLSVLSVMIFFSGWISLRSIKELRLQLLPKSILAILLGAGLTLIFITQIVFKLQPWFEPRYFIPLAGMIFATAMNAVSLGAERYVAEMGRKESYSASCKIAYRASLIPIINSLFAVGLVSMPGMMTGQILSGVSPFIAVRYQIVVMCMLLSSAGLSSYLFLTFLKNIDLKTHLAETKASGAL